MVRINKITEYGIRVLKAMHQAGGGTISSVRIGEMEDIPAPMLMKVLRKLRQSEIITSTRGRGDSCGGYAIAVDLGECTILDFLERLEDGVCLSGYILEDDAELEFSDRKIHDTFSRINAELKQSLSEITLLELYEQRPESDGRTA